MGKAEQDRRRRIPKKLMRKKRKEGEDGEHEEDVDEDEGCL